MENQVDINLEPVDNFSMLSEDDQSSIWGRFTSSEYDYAGIMNVLLLVVIFIAAKFVFKSFIMSQKRVKKDKADNFAYAISYCSFFISLAIILTSVGYGDVTTSWIQGATKTLTYAAMGITLLIITGLIFDKITLSKFSLNKQIAEGNVAAGIADAGNFLAAALIISSSLMWQEFKQAEAMLAILGIYGASQLLMVLATFLRTRVFNMLDREIPFYQQIKNNNTAVAIDFAGRRVGNALAITAATNLLSYQNSISLSEVILEWLAVSVILLIALNILSWFASKIIFWGTNTHNETINRNNSIALVNAALYISFGIIISNSMY